MKIADRSGHNRQATGASDIVDEVTEDRKILASVNKYLKLDNSLVLDVTPGNCISSVDLAYGVNKSNAYNPELFASIHLNSGGGKGVEVLYFGGSSTSKAYATRVCNSIANLGFTNRGAKVDVRALYELRHTKSSAIIIEVFFLDSQLDVDLYNKLGVDRIGKAIAEGIVGHAIGSVVNSDKVITTPKDDKILLLQKVCNRVGIRGANDKALIEDGYDGLNTQSAKKKLKIYIDSILS